MFRRAKKKKAALKPKKTGLVLVNGENWGGGGALGLPLEISAVDCSMTAKICTMVVCDVIYKPCDIFRLFETINFRRKLH